MELYFGFISECSTFSGFSEDIPPSFIVLGGLNSFKRCVFSISDTSPQKQISAKEIWDMVYLEYQILFHLFRYDIYRMHLVQWMPNGNIYMLA